MTRRQSSNRKPAGLNRSLGNSLVNDHARGRTRQKAHESSGASKKNFVDKKVCSSCLVHRCGPGCIILKTARSLLTLDSTLFANPVYF